MCRPGRAHALVLLAVSAAAVAGCERPQADPAPPKPPVVVVSRAQTDLVTEYEDFTGRTDSIPSVEIRARVAGYLQKVDFKDGDEMKKGDMLFEIDDRPYAAELTRTESALAQSEARLKRLEADFRRISTLFARNNASREEYDKIIGDRAEGEAMVGIARSNYDLAKLNVAFCKIAAPIDGRVSRRLVDPGNLVEADKTPLTTIVSLDPLYVYFDVDERTLLRLRRLIREGKLKSRAEAPITVQIGLSDEEGYSINGVIDFSDNRVDASTGTLRVRAKIDNPKPYVLSPGLFVRVRVPIGQPQRSVLVEERAVASNQSEKFVYVVNDKNEVETRRITAGKLEGGRRVVKENLKEGERVVVSGLQRVRPGLKVDPRTQDEMTKKASPAPGRPKAATASAPAGAVKGG